MDFKQFYLSELDISPTSILRKKFLFLVKKIFVNRNNVFSENDDLSITKDDLNLFQKLNLLIKTQKGIQITNKGICLALGMKISFDDPADIYTKDQISSFVQKRDKELDDEKKSMYRGWLTVDKGELKKVM